MPPVTATDTAERTLEIGSGSYVALHTELQYAAGPRVFDYEAARAGTSATAAASPAADRTDHCPGRSDATMKPGRIRSPGLRLPIASATLCTVLCACAHSPTSATTADDMTASPHATLTELRIELGPEQSASLRAELFYSSESRTVYVRYRIRNDSTDHRLAVFDRGVYGDWAGAVYAPGPVGSARIESEGGDLTVAHVAVPPPDEDPLQRQAPLARVLAPSQEQGDESATQLPMELSPDRLRWCIGVARFDKSAFEHPQDTARGVIWIAKEAAIAAQQRVCTPWYDVATARFEA